MGPAGGVIQNMRMIACVAVALACMAAAADAEVVTFDDVECRQEPSLKAVHLATLTRGDRVVVLSRRDVWAQVERPQAPCWVPGAFLLSDKLAEGMSMARPDPTTPPAPSAPSTAIGSWAAPPSSPTAYTGGRVNGYPYTAPVAASRKARKTRSARTASRAYAPSSAGGSCPCGTGAVCVGPRGGRYCITSGGNKRYGV